MTPPILANYTTVVKANFGSVDTDLAIIDNMYVNRLNATGDFYASRVETGLVSAGTVNGTEANFVTINATNLNTTNLSLTNINASNGSFTGPVSAGSVSTTSLQAYTINGQFISASSLYAGSASFSNLDTYGVNYQLRNGNTQFASNFAIDWTLNVQRVVLAQNSSVSFAVNPIKTTNLTLVIAQDAVGGHSISFPGAMKWVGGTVPAISQTANSVSVVECLYVDISNEYLCDVRGAGYQ